MSSGRGGLFVFMACVTWQKWVLPKWKLFFLISRMSGMLPSQRISKPYVHYCFCINMFCKSNYRGWMKYPAQYACRVGQQYWHQMRWNLCSSTCAAHTLWWVSSCMALGCDWWNAWHCGSRMLILKGVKLRSVMARGGKDRMTILPLSLVCEPDNALCI